MLKICVSNTPWETNSLSALCKLTIIGKDTAEGMAAWIIIKSPKSEETSNFMARNKKIRGTNIILSALASKTIGKFLRSDAVSIRASQQPKINIERTKLASPVILMGLSKTCGMNFTISAYTKITADIVAIIGGVKIDFNLSCSPFFLKIK